MAYANAEQIAERLHFTEEDVFRINQITDQYPMLISEYYLNLIDPDDPNDPIRKMSVPSNLEAGEDGCADTSGEHDNTVIPGLQHKYKATAMILSTNQCAMYCRHCFRKRFVGLSDEEVAQNFQNIMDYIRDHQEITNVLISGGDAFMNDNATLERYLKVLTAIDHLDFIRFGTRTPVTLPDRITKSWELCAMLKHYNEKKQLYVITQFNHPKEITEESKAAVRSLRATGAVVRNQTVLLRGVNDNPEILASLLRQLTSIGCIPYYIFQCRPVRGVKNHFQVPMSEGLDIVEAAKVLQSGQGKNVKYCLSHPTGKLEIVGKTNTGGIILKYHQAKNPADSGKLILKEAGTDPYWL